MITLVFRLNILLSYAQYVTKESLSEIHIHSIPLKKACSFLYLFYLCAQKMKCERLQQE